MPTFPSTPKPASCKIRSTSPAYVSTAQSLRQVVSSRNAHRWAFELAYPPMTRDQYAVLWAFLNDQQGRAGSFDFVLPEHAARGSMAGTPLVNGAAQTGKTITTDGWTASRSGVLKAGDFIRIGDDLKTYQVTADVNSDSAGEAVIPINTPLAAVPADNDAVIADSQFRCALVDDANDTSISTELHYVLKIELLEVLY
jgi:hypothetical protein